MTKLTIRPNNSLSFISYVFIFLVIVSCNRSNNTEGGLLWEISGNGIKEPSYLLGTDHGMHGDFLDSIPGVFEALNSVKQMAVESDYSVPKKLDSIKPIQLHLPKGIKYSDLLDEIELALLDSVLLIYYKVNTEQISFKPNVLMARLGVRINKKESQKWARTNPFLLNVSFTGKSMDLKLKRMAIAKHLPIIELDLAEELDRLGIRDMSILFSSEKLEERAKESVQMIKELKEDTIIMQLARKSKEAYYNQDLALLEEMLTHPNLLNTDQKKLIYKTLIIKRNLFWMDKIKSSIHENSTFIKVGAGHLVGKKGVINLLRSEGYTVSPVM